MPEVLRGSPKKHNIYKRQKNYDKEQLVADALSINWNTAISPNNMDSNYSLDKFLEHTMAVVDKHAPLKK